MSNKVDYYKNFCILPEINIIFFLSTDCNKVKTDMAAKQKNIFTRSKPLINIYSGLDHEGKEVWI